MNLRSPTPPPGTDAALQTAVRKMNVTRFAAAGGGAPAATPTAPHKVYAIDKGDLAARNLSAARQVGWRVLLLNGPVAAAAVGLSAGGGGPVRFRAIHYGPFVESARKGIEEAERTVGGSSADYELRLLEAPSVHLLSLWLEGNADDFFVPLEPAPPPFIAERVYSKDEFFDFASKLAQLQSGAQPPPTGNPPFPPP